MGNCCSQKQQNDNTTLIKKVSITSSSTCISQLNSICSMKRQSHKLLKFLQNEKQGNLSMMGEQVKEIEVVSQLGKGGQSKVFEIIVKGSNRNSSENIEEQKIAVKRTNISKQRGNLYSLELSRKLLAENQSPFLISGLFCYSSEKYQFSGMPIAQGGDLSSFLERWRGKGDAFRKLGQYGIKMVLPGIILGLQYLHQKHLIYCDLKIDNVLIDKNGYPLLADFQLITNRQSIPIKQFHGTITSMGPQFYCQASIDKGIDIWTLGILVFTITFNQLPFKQCDIVKPQFVSLCQMMENNYTRERHKLISESLSNLINSLLKKDPKQRIGYRSISQIKNHRFFQGLDWQRYYRKQLENPLAEIVRNFPIKSRCKIGDRNGKREDRVLIDVEQNGGKGRRST